MQGRSDCASGRSPRRGVRGGVDDGVAGRKIARAGETLGFALDEAQIPAGVHALDLLIARVARREGIDEQPFAAQTRADDLNAVGTLWMSDPAKVLAVERIGNELQR